MEQTLPAIPRWADPEDKAITGELVGPVNPKTWQTFIGLVADGHLVPEAMRESGIRRHQLEGALRVDSNARAQYEEAKIAAVRRNWDVETIEEVFTRLMTCEQGGYLVKILEDMGLDSASFYRLIQRDPQIKEMYDEARQIQAEVMADELQAIADYGMNDTYTDRRGNVRVDQDVVQRSRLRVDTLKWRLAKLHHKRFGDRIQQDQSIDLKVDHVSRLDEARKRLASHRAGVKAKRETGDS